MPAINTISGIAPGKILYFVYGSLIAKNPAKRGIDIEANINKIIVTSFPKHWYYGTQTRTRSLYFDILCESSFCKDMWRSGHSVRDCGIDCPNGKYNLNRIFATKIEAREFISECLIGKFFDREDQEVYNRAMMNCTGDFI